MRFLLIPLFLFSIVLIGGCGSSHEKNNGLPPEVQTDPIYRTRVAWDYTSLERLGEDYNYAGYPRMIRLSNGALFLTYEFEGNVVLKKSFDNGDSWGARQVVFHGHVAETDRGSVDIHISNPEIIELENGDLLMACNYRPRKDEIAPFAIVVTKSIDQGETWSQPNILYGSEPRFRDGCWEPAFLQLPDGTVQIYFANENPYTNSDEQEISLLESYDNGESWTKEHRTVCFRKGFRDGMSVPILLNDEIVITIEDNGVGKFKPYTIRNKIVDNWKKPVYADSPLREYALKKKVGEQVYMGAPYIVKLPSGETMISYQSTRNRSDEWEQSTMEIAIGDNNARNFELAEYPFTVPIEREAKWGSVMLWDEGSVAALSSSNWDGGNITVWMKKGHLIPKYLDGSEEGYPIFIGSKHKPQLKARVNKSTDVVQIDCRVSNVDLSSVGAGNGNGVYFYLDLNYGVVDKTYKLWVPVDGQMMLYKSNGSKWGKVDEVGLFNVAIEKQSSDYSVVLTIAKQHISTSSFNLSLALSAKDDNNNVYVEPLVKSNEFNVETWLNVERQ